MLSLPKRQLNIDIGPLLENQWTGIPVFCRRVVQSLLPQSDLHLSFSFDLVQIPHNLVMEALKSNSGGFLRDSFERRASDLGYVSNAQIPIFYPTVKSHCGASAHEASTVHDMSTLLMPENHERENIDYHLGNLDQELATSEVIFCVSEATRAALGTAFPSYLSKTRILYQYADWPENFRLIDNNLPALKLGRFAVVIGTLEPRKNLGLLLNALNQPEISNSDLKFIIIGRKGWKIDELLKEITPEHRSRILLSGFVSEFVKYRLLRHCEFLIFPSVYEGFGIPALEAMILGKPVLAAMTSSFPEVIGEGGIFFDPNSPSDFAEGFERMSHKRTQEELSPRAVKQASLFNPARMQSEIMKWVLQY